MLYTGTFIGPSLIPRAPELNVSESDPPGPLIVDHSTSDMWGLGILGFEVLNSLVCLGFQLYFGSEITNELLDFTKGIPDDILPETEGILFLTIRNRLQTIINYGNSSKPSLLYTDLVALHSEIGGSDQALHTPSNHCIAARIDLGHSIIQYFLIWFAYVDS